MLKKKNRREKKLVAKWWRIMTALNASWRDTKDERYQWESFAQYAVIFQIDFRLFVRLDLWTKI